MPEAPRTITDQLAEFITIFGAEWVMWLLIGLSVVSVSVMVERWWFHLRRKPDMDRLFGAIAGRDAQAASGPSIEAAVVRDLLRVTGSDRGRMDAERAASVQRERGGYERGLSFLGTLGNNAPFVGLFGTVLGIIKAFADLATNVQGGAQVVMAGISEALVATAIGLAVALPAVVAFNVFKGKTKEAYRRVDVLAEAAMAGPPLRDGATSEGSNDSDDSDDSDDSEGSEG